MMGNTNKNWVEMSDSAIALEIGAFIKHNRLQQNKTQAQLAEMAGLNRWTISQIENGESITLASMIQILRALNQLSVLSSFEVIEEISPIEYAKLKKKQKQRARNNTSSSKENKPLEW